MAWRVRAMISSRLSMVQPRVGIGSWKVMRPAAGSASLRLAVIAVRIFGAASRRARRLAPSYFAGQARRLFMTLARAFPATTVRPKRKWKPCKAGGRAVGFG